MVHVLLKPCLVNFEHYFASVWDECSCVVVWTFFALPSFFWGLEWKPIFSRPVVTAEFSRFAGVGYEVREDKVQKKGTDMLQE